MHRVNMRFERIFDRWTVCFVNLDTKEMLREYTFADESKIEQLAERTGALSDLAAKPGLEHGLRNGSGAIMMELTPEQYGRLRR